MNRSLFAEIDLGAIISNLRAVRKFTSDRKVIAVVKADAYGHGAVEVARAIEKQNPFALAVAFVSEAVSLRDAGIKCPILVLFEKSNLNALFDYDLTPAIHDLKTAKQISKEARKRGIVKPFHLKIDTGMGRMGITPDLLKINEIINLKNIELKGLMSHFSEAELEDPEYARLQLKRFLDIKASIEADGLNPVCHMANSAGTIGFPESHLDAVRPGLMLYGVSPRHDRTFPQLRPALRVTTKLLSIKKLPKGHPISYGRTFITTRPTVAGVIQAGYADGFLRSLSSKAEVLVRGCRVPVVGRVCMDLTVVDLTGVKNVSEGDEVTLLGKDGNDEITAWEMAQTAGTIPYELLISLASRAKKIYK